jgi:hypothetical protein
MAHAANRHVLAHEIRRHDGVLRCRLCVNGRLGEDHAWCPVVQAVVCDDCCRALSTCDVRSILAANDASPRLITPVTVASECTLCERFVSDEEAEMQSPDEPAN